MPFRRYPPHVTSRAALPPEPRCTNPFLGLALSFIHARARSEKESAGGKPPFLILMRCLLLFNALADNFNRGATAVAGEVAGRPHRTAT